MITDFQILGIEPTSDLQAIKKAYRRRVKETHPDNSSPEDSFKNHLLFIQTNQAYNRLKNGNTTPFPETNVPPQDQTSKNPLQKHSDPAYAFYKAGMNYFMKIHPSQWHQRETDFDTNKLPMSEEERTRVYAKIYESFNAWPNVAKEKAKWLQGIIRRTDGLTEIEGHRMKWPK
jgi:hypothetical protein